MRIHLKELIVPPSVNRLWAISQGRRVRSTAYKDWLHMVGFDIKAQVRRPVSESTMPEKTPLYVFISMNINRKSDLDNRIKACLDALQHARIIPDDRWVDELHVKRDKRLAVDTMTITVQDY